LLPPGPTPGARRRAVAPRAGAFGLLRADRSR